MDANEKAVITLLEMLGEDPFRDGLIGTPARVVKALKELTSGYGQCPKSILETTFDVAYDQIIMLQGVRFQSMCEHHMLPFIGVAHVGYLPCKRVVGLSKLARLIQCFARRLQIQERMTMEIAEAIMTHLNARGCGVIVQAQHSCMGHRGAKQPDAMMKTSAMLGEFRTNADMRLEFLRLLG